MKNSDSARLITGGSLGSTASARSPLTLGIVIALSVSLSACAMRPVRTEAGGVASAVTSGSESAAPLASNSNGASSATESETSSDLADSGADLLGIPLEVNRLVLKWIDYFQGPGRHHMERYLSRSTRYAPIMKDILRKEGLPEDLIYIALIESGFSATAHSSANAVGYWQFIRGTGKQYRLRIDSFVDERRDFERATVAAADYFKGLYNLFGAWYLAIASYNVGENRVKSLVMRNKTRDFWKLARENRLPQETVNYVPKFLAARLIAKEPAKYGFTDVEYMPPLSFDTVAFDSPIDIRRLASEMALDYDDLRDLNPAYKRGVAPMPRSGDKLVLRVPKGLQEKALAAAPAARANLASRYVAEDDYSYYRVRRGDTIASIARKFNVSQSKILRLNRLSARSVLSVGKRLRVPSENVATLGPGKSSQLERSSGQERQPSNDASEKQKPQSTKLAAQDRVVSKATERVTQKGIQAAKKRNAKLTRQVHIVRRGENLALIAKRYGVSVRQLVSHNGLKKPSTLFVGKKLEIPNF
jgi:membrane-bound lytic murein transglycosylase D